MRFIRGAAMIHIIDDEDSVRVMVRGILRASGYEVSVYGCVGEFLLQHPSEPKGCLLLDVEMPLLGGFELHEELVRRGMEIPVIYLSGHADVSMTVRAMRAGAVDFLTKPVLDSALVAAVERALLLSVMLDRKRASVRRWAERVESLTAREFEILLHVLSGHLNKQIASDLGVAERTVKAHRTNIMGKMEVDSVAELVKVVHELKSAGGLREAPPGGAGEFWPYRDMIG